MDFFTALLKSYEHAEEEGWVDNASKGTMLLPIYHESKKTSKELIIAVTLDNKGEFIKADFLVNGDTITFPVTAISAIRTSNSVPHPLVDQMKYLTYEVKQSLNDDYHTQLNEWIKFTENTEVKKYLQLIQAFLKCDTFLDKIFTSLYGNNYSRKGLTVELKNKKGTIDFTKCYIEFKIDNFSGLKTVSVTNYIELHKDYIQFVNSKQTEKIICNISGCEEGLQRKHRGVIGNAKLISGSDTLNDENYKGRFTSIHDVIQIGYQTSEKIHLLVKYFLENEHTHAQIGGGQYLINWFSDDLANNSQLTLTKPYNSMFEEEDEEEDATAPKFTISERNTEIKTSFIRGQKQFKDASSYYAAILNKTSDGRVALKYFRQLKVSRLLENLNQWQEKYSWERHYKDGQCYSSTPNLMEIILVAYGVEREKVWKLDNDSFKSDLYQQLITALLDGQGVPNAIVKKLENNIRQRQRYPEKWYQVQQVSLGILHRQNGKEFTPMLDREETDRSYLFGRLLAIYELIEIIHNQFKEPDKKKDKRVTNAERYWTAYTNQPATIMTVLNSKVRYCIDYLQINKTGYWRKIENELKEIIQLLSPIMKDKSINQPLDYKFIFGYYAEKQFYYTKQTKENEE